MQKVITNSSQPMFDYIQGYAGDTQSVSMGIDGGSQHIRGLYGAENGWRDLGAYLGISKPIKRGY